MPRFLFWIPLYYVFETTLTDMLLHKVKGFSARRQSHTQSRAHAQRRGALASMETLFLKPSIYGDVVLDTLHSVACTHALEARIRCTNAPSLWNMHRMEHAPCDAQLARPSIGDGKIDCLLFIDCLLLIDCLDCFLLIDCLFLIFFSGRSFSLSSSFGVTRCSA